MTQVPRRFARLFPTLPAGLVLAIVAAPAGWALPEEDTGSSPDPADDRAVPTHMSEDLRSGIHKLVVVSRWSGTDQEFSGTYGKATPGAVGGMERGARLGRIYKEVGPVPVYIPIPGVALPAAIFGGVTGAAQRRVQEFRDRMTEELASEDNQVLTDDGLALDVFWGVRRLPGIESKLIAADVEMPDDTDALLFVRFEGVSIDVQDKDAVITTSAAATLRRPDGRELYSQLVSYRDRDTLRNWTADDNALWRTYSNFARHWLGREIAAEVFDRIAIPHHVTPQATTSAVADRRNDRQFNASGLRPTLAWSLEFTPGDDDWTGAIDESNTFYDVEVYDDRQLVYAEEGVHGSTHTIAYDLEPCRNYRWSVRPAWQVDGKLRYGEWMRYEPPPPVAQPEKKKRAKPAPAEPPDETTIGRWLIGREASQAPAYTQDFPLLATNCRR